MYVSIRELLSLLYTSGYKIFKIDACAAIVVLVIPKTSSGLGTHLFVKVPRPRDSEATFSVF